MIAVESLIPGAIQTASFALQCALGLVFLAAAVPKVARPWEFAATVAGFQIVPRGVTVAALLIILAECVAAASLITGWAAWIGLASTLGLVIMFAGATGANLRRGHLVDCGCFGAKGDVVSARSLWRLVAIGTGSVALAFLWLTGLGSPTLTTRILELGASGVAYFATVLGLGGFYIAVAALALNADHFVVAIRRGDATHD